MCLLCDDEKAYQAYMNYLDAAERQGKAADPNTILGAVLDQLEAADKARAQSSWIILYRPTNPPSPRRSGATARSCSASSTMTSLPWARRTRPPASAPSPIRGGARAPIPR